MSEVIFIRYAETDMAGTFCGHSDPGLNAEGWRQLPELIKKLRDRPIEILYASDLRRAQQTAATIAAHFELECRMRQDLREMYFGRWEGLCWGEIEEREPEEARRWLAEHPHGDFPEGETMQTFRARVLREVRLCMDGSAGKTVAIVTHGGVIRMALTELFGMAEEESWERTKRYGSVIRVDCSGPVEA